MNRSPAVSLVVLFAMVGPSTVLAGGTPGVDFPVVVERAGAALPDEGKSVTLGEVNAATAQPETLGVKPADAAADAVTGATAAGVSAAEDVVASPALDDASGVDTTLRSSAGRANGVGSAADNGLLSVDDNRQQGVEIYVGDKVVQLEYLRGSDEDDPNQARTSVAFMLSEERDNIFIGNYMIDTNPDLVSDFTLSVGARGYVALLGQENRDVFGLGVGVEAGYVLPFKGLPLQIDAGLFYVPDVLAFGQSDRIIDWNVDVGLQLRDRLTAFAGLRFLQFDTRPGDREVDDGVHVGMRWAFAQ